MNTFSTPAPIAVTLNIPAGTVRVNATDRTDTVVTVQPADPGKKRDLKAADQTEVTYTDGTLTIATADPNRLFGSSGSLNVTIDLPAGSHLTGTAGAAALHTTGTLDHVHFTGGYQNVDIAHANDLTLAVHTGTVTIAHLAGPAHITNGMGDITITDAHTGHLDLTTGSGNLTVTAAPDTDATLNASTGYGRITNALRNTAGATAPLTITATTGQGDVTATTR